ncbi:ABC transporter permease, partial [Brucella anthropi]
VTEVLTLATMEAAASHTMLSFKTTHDGSVVFKDIEVRCNVFGPSVLGTLELSERTVDVKTGETVMFTGSAANLRTIVLTLAQNWPWGSGTIALPADADTLFLSRDTWLPEESIGSVLEYPDDPRTDNMEVYRKALKTVGLERLSEQLEKPFRWDRLLNHEDQMRLSFARLLIRRPRCVVMDDTFEGLDTQTAAALCSILREQFAPTTLYFGTSQVFLDSFSPRVIEIRGKELQ